MASSRWGGQPVAWRRRSLHFHYPRFAAASSCSPSISSAASVRLSDASACRSASAAAFAASGSTPSRPVAEIEPLRPALAERAFLDPAFGFEPGERARHARLFEIEPQHQFGLGQAFALGDLVERRELGRVQPCSGQRLAQAVLQLPRQQARDVEQAFPCGRTYVPSSQRRATG